MSCYAMCEVCAQVFLTSQSACGVCHEAEIQILVARIAVLERQRDEYGEWLQAAYDNNGCDCLSLYFALNQFETVFPEIAEETPND